VISEPDSDWFWEVLDSLILHRESNYIIQKRWILLYKFCLKSKRENSVKTRLNSMACPKSSIVLC